MPDAALTPRQARVVVALASGSSVAEAARAGGVSSRTVARWQKMSHFQAAVHEATDQAMAAISRQLVDLSTKAVEVIRETMEEDNATLRLRAADVVIGRALQLRESVSLSDRVAVLERAQAQRRRR